MKWIKGFWYRRLRRIDVEILWPSIRDRAITLNHAHRTFRMHAYQDKAWRILGTNEINRIVDGLK
jgi:hypothetical protein